MGVSQNVAARFIPIMKPSLYSIESDYGCIGDLIARLHRFKFIQSMNKKCDEVSGEIHSYKVNAFFKSNKTVQLSVSATTFIDDYKGFN